MSLFSRWFGSKERRILILGLDGAGKLSLSIALISCLFKLNFIQIKKAKQQFSIDCK